MSAEGWYVDPYGLHEARWISDGTPTSLVRDGELEAKDPPPDTPFTGQLRELPENAPADGADLRRADSAEASSAGSASGEDVFEAFVESSGSD
jgi:hypothetical protein